jgi:hypothetical protein
MVSKLLLAVQETFLRAAADGTSKRTLRQLAHCYYDIRRGIGDSKTPAEYGAFPADPYSHTPGHAGARQPGLTGQVKEDFLCRMGELGVIVSDGRILFRPLLLQKTEFLTESAGFHYYDVARTSRRLRLSPGSLAFTYCQVPVVYRWAREDRLVVSLADGSEVRLAELCLDAATSRSVFSRDAKVGRITVHLREGLHGWAGA